MANQKNKETKKHVIPLVFGALIGVGGLSGGIVMSLQSCSNPIPADLVTLTFNANGGVISGKNIIQAQIDQTFGQVIKPEATQLGQLFEGWYEESDCINKISDNTPISSLPKIIYANYVNETNIHVRFEKGQTGCEFAGNTDVVVTTEGTLFQDVNKPNATLSGKILDHWSKDAETNIPMGDTDPIPNEGITLYPVFNDAPTDYVTLTFDKNGGNELQGTATFNIPTTTQFSTMPKPIATKNGKDFKFWSLSSDQTTAKPIDDKQTFAKATKIYAIYKDVNFAEKICCEFGEGTSKKLYWLTNPTSTTEDLIFQDTDGNQIVEQRDTFNKTIIIGSEVKTIGINFLYGCLAFNNGYVEETNAEPIPLVVPASVESIGDSFLHLCGSFNQPIDLSACSKLTNIGSSFLQYCIVFNQPITWPPTHASELTIGAFFLQSCLEFNQKLSLPENCIEAIPSSFMAGCEAFNNGQDYDPSTEGTEPFIIPSSVKKISSYFLSSCFAGVIGTKVVGFNQPITIPSSVESIGEDFLYGDGAFNSSVTFECNIKEIPDAFLTGCTRFNKPITIPSSVTKIGDYFLYTCQSFDQPLTIPDGVTSLGSSFLSRCLSFNQDITFGPNIKHIGINLMYYCAEMVKTVTIDCDPSQVFAQGSDNYTLSSGSPTSPCIVQGITISSTKGYASAFRSKFGNMVPSTQGGSVTTPPYRVLK